MQEDGIAVCLGTPALEKVFLLKPPLFLEGLTRRLLYFLSFS